MKWNKIYTLVLMAVAFAACSDDSVSWNTGSATVSMQQEELEFKENKGLVSIPIVIEGTQNGPIQVTVKVAEATTSPAMDDVHYIITSKTIVIPADSETASIEIMTVDDTEINEDRSFTMSIDNVQGATIGANPSTLIVLKDNDAAFYEKFIGKWKFKAAKTSDDSPVSYDVNITGFDEGEAGYDEILYVSGIMGYSWTQMQLNYSYDIATNKISISIPMGTLFAENVGFGLKEGNQDVYLATVVDGNLVFDTSIQGTVNEDFTAITFEDLPLYGRLFDAGTKKANNYTWFGFKNMSIVK